MRFSRRYLLVAVFVVACKSPGASKSPEPVTADGLVAAMSSSAELRRLRVPPGFRVEFFARGVENARAMARGDDGTIYVGSRRAGNVYALPDRDGDGRADEVRTIAKGLNSPNGVAMREGSLYVAEIGRILRYDQIAKRLEAPGEPVVVTDLYPENPWHGWKHIAFGPDGKLYVPVGAPCNVCTREEDVFSTITRIDPDGKNFEIVAKGVRNSVGFDWHPETGRLWFTDNGRDQLGDEIPPDELNEVTALGQHFGFPHCHGGDLQDPEFGRSCVEFVPPVQKLGPHVAALGVTFYDGAQFPASFHGQPLIAEHGSWNRSTPIGYRVTRVTLDPKTGRATSYEPFLQGWLLQGGERWGRPVASLVLPDGSLLVSDDHNDAIYRVTYER